MNQREKLERERGLLVNLRQVWIWYRGSEGMLRRLRRSAVREVIVAIRKVRAA